MSKKKLQVEQVTNELEGASLYFSRPSGAIASKPRSEQSESAPSSEKMPQEAALKAGQKHDRLNKPANDQASISASKQASTESNEPREKQDDIVETIRKTVKKVGKEVSFVRLTPEEKHELGTVVYTFNELYRGEGRRTSENEIGRIAFNYLLNDYREHGELSILARVLAALNA